MNNCCNRWGSCKDDESTLFNRFQKALQETIVRFPLKKEEESILFNWIQEIAKKRVAGILENKARRAYDRAADLIAACLEVLQIRGRTAEGKTLCAEIKEQFPRHRAFHDALAIAIRRSSTANLYLKPSS